MIALQAEVARDIAAAIARGDTAATSPPAARTSIVNPEAYNLYLKGLQATGGVTYEGYSAAASYFEQAIASQPDFGRAHARLALTWVQFLNTGPIPPAEVLPKAESAAQKAVALDDTLSEAHRALAMVRNVYADYAAAVAEADRAVELAPFSADSLRLQARLLMSAGQTEEAVVAAERAKKLDPLSVNAIGMVARTLSAAGHHTRAIEELNKALKMAPQRADVPFQLGATYVLKGDINAAIPEFERALALSTQRNPRFRAYLAFGVRDSWKNTRVTADPAGTVGAPRSTVRLLLRDCSYRRWTRREGGRADGTRARISGARGRICAARFLPAIQNARVRTAVSGRDAPLRSEPLNKHSTQPVRRYRGLITGPALTLIPEPGVDDRDSSGCKSTP